MRSQEVELRDTLQPVYHTSNEANGVLEDWRRVSAAGLLILLALVIGLSVGMLIRTSAKADWVEAVGTWVGALFTGGGFYAAFIELRRGRTAQETARAAARAEELARQEAMARAVALKINWGSTNEAVGTTTADVEVLNGGPYPIQSAVLKIQTDDVPMQIVLGTIFPSEHIRTQYEVARREVVFGELTTGAKLYFTDTYGNGWARTGTGLVRADPPRVC